MDRQRMKRNLCYGLLVAVGLAAIAGGAVVLLGRGSADAAEARLPDGAGIAIDGRAGAAEWAHCLSQRFEESGLLRAAWDPDYVYVLVAEDLPARKAGSDGDMVIARLHVDGHRVYAFFKESWTETGRSFCPLTRPLTSNSRARESLRTASSGCRSTRPLARSSVVQRSPASPLSRSASAEGPSAAFPSASCGSTTHRFYPRRTPTDPELLHHGQAHRHRRLQRRGRIALLPHHLPGSPGAHGGGHATPRSPCTRNAWAST